MNHIQVHRFGDCLAIYTGGETTYLSLADSRKLTRAMNRVNRSLEREKFTDSTCGTFSLDCKDGRKSSRDYS